MKNVLLWLILLVIAFLAGFIPQYIERLDVEKGRQQDAERYQVLLAEARERNRVLVLHSQLGMLLIEAQDSNFGLARQRSTELFDGVLEAIAQTSDENMKTGLASIAAQRDEITAGLTAARPEVASALRKLYQELAKATGTL